MTKPELDAVVVIGELKLRGRDEDSRTIRWHALEIGNLAESGDVQFFINLGKLLES